MLSAFEIYQRVVESERQTLRAHKRREIKKGKSKKSLSPSPFSDDDSGSSGNESHSEHELEMQDCIKVHQI